MRKSALVVDDEYGSRILVSVMLERGGFDVLKAKDADEALYILEQITPSMIIIDVMMPGTNGLELTQIIRSRSDTIDTPILILSARGDAESVMRGMEAGANDYLPKPILHHDLVAKCRAMLDIVAIDSQTKIPDTRDQQQIDNSGENETYDAHLKLLSSKNTDHYADTILKLSRYYKETIVPETVAQQIFWKNIRHKADGSSPEILTQLKQEWVRKRDIAIVFTLSETEQNEKLRAMLKNRDALPESILIDVVASIGHNKLDEIEELVKLLSHENSQIREVTIRSMGLIGTAETIPHIEKAFEDEASGVRLEAALALVENASEEALQILKQKLLDGEKSIRVNVVNALRRLNADEAINIVSEAIKQENEPNILFAMLQIQGQVSAEKADEAKEIINQFLDHDNDHVRRGAKDALFELETQELGD